MCQFENLKIVKWWGLFFLMFLFSCKLEKTNNPKIIFETIDTDFSKGRLNQKQIVTINDLEKFHGHLCDGLVVGLLAMQEAMKELYPNQPIDRTNLRIVCLVLK